MKEELFENTQGEADSAENEVISENEKAFQPEEESVNEPAGIAEETSEGNFDLIYDIIENAEAYRETSEEQPPPGGDKESSEDEAEEEESSKPFITMQKLNGIKGKIKDSGIFDSDMLKDMFFGTQTSGSEPSEKENIEDIPIDEDENDPVLFDKKRKKRITADPEQDKIIFSTEYMLTPDQAIEGYMLFYSEFVKKRNIRWTVLFGILALIFLISAAMSDSGYIEILLTIICLTVIALKWLNTATAGKEAALSAEDVKNDTYKLTFYNSRILIETSQLAGDRIYHYPPVMIRFEDIDLKVIDYKDMYVLIFKRDYIYTVPRSAMNEKMNGIFRAHLENILGDDYHELFDAREKNNTDDNNNKQEDGGEG